MTVLHREVKTLLTTGTIENRIIGMKKSNGFTLIEVLITVAIIGIIAAVALPAFTGYMVKGRRADAITTLTELAGDQFRYFSENNTYATKLTDLGYSADTVATDNGFYNVSVTSGSANAYLITAVPLGVQAAKDTDCVNLTINSIGTKGVSGTGSVTDCW